LILLNLYAQYYYVIRTPPGNPHSVVEEIKREAPWMIEKGSDREHHGMLADGTWAGEKLRKLISESPRSARITAEYAEAVSWSWITIVPVSMIVDERHRHELLLTRSLYARKGINQCVVILSFPSPLKNALTDHGKRIINRLVSIINGTSFCSCEYLLALRRRV
jgi:hypothetical protein